MDQRLLDALNNLSYALEEIADSLNSRNQPKSDTASALSSGNFSQVLSEIGEGVKSIKKDTVEILKKQDTIIELSKSKDSDNKTKTFEDAGDPKKAESIKKGVGTILLIAVGVLAIGAAFKLIGNVNFLSVIGLGVGIYMVSLAFERIAKLDIDIKRAGMASLFMVMASGAILASSMILSKVKTISFGQIISIASIAVLFHFMIPIMANVINSITTNKKMTLPNGQVVETTGVSYSKLLSMIVGLPLLITGMSLGIMLGSEFLSKTKTVSFSQILTIGSIALLFHFVMPAMAQVMGVLEGNTKVILPNGTVIEKTGLSFSKLIGMVFALPLLMVGMSLGIMLASKILTSVTPLSFTKILTSIAISGMFAIVASGVTKLLGVFFQSGFSFGKLLAAVVVLPILLLGISVGIMLSSYVLDKVKPIGLAQAFSSILIAGVFAVISLGIGKLVTALASIGNPMKILFAAIAIPIILPALAFSIMVSSYLLDKVKPIGLAQFVTSVAIAAVFIVFGFTIRALGKSIKDVSIGSVFKIPILFTALSLAVMLSSEILSKVVEIPYGKMLNILAFSVVLGVAMIVMAFSSKLVNKFGSVVDYIKSGLSIIVLSGIILASSAIISNYKEIETSKLLNIMLFSATLAISVILLAIPIYLISKFLKRKDVVDGTVSLILIATSIMAASLILSVGNYDKYPDWKWVLGSVLSIAAFGLMIYLLKMSKLSVGDVAKGSLVIVGVAAVIAATSFILSVGKYEKYPTTDWVLGVTLAIGLFSVGALGLGLLVSGPQGLLVLAGLGSILVIAGAIIAVSQILAKGDFKSYPSIEWSRSVSNLLQSFAQVAISTSTISDKKIKDSIVLLSSAIQESSVILSTGNYKSGPTKEWASGVSLAMRAFMPIYDMIVESQSIFSSITGKSGVTPKKFSDAIKVVSNGIISAAEEFSKSPNMWKNGPTSEWSSGVSKAIRGFMPLYDMMTSSQSILSSITGSAGVTPKKFSDAIKVVSRGIITAANEFAKNPGVWKNGPTFEWSKGVSKSIKGFMPLYEMLLNSNSFMASFTGSTGITPKKFSDAIKVVSRGIITAANEFAKNPTVWQNGPSFEWSKGVGRAIKGFYPVYEMLIDSNSFMSKFTGSAGVTPKKFSDAIVVITKGIVSAAHEFVKSPSIWQNGPDPKWAKGVSIAIEGFYPIYEILLKSNSIFASITGAKGITPEKYKNAIVTIVGGMVTAANELAKSPDIWKNGPKESWGKGVSAAISGFYPIYEILLKSNSIFASITGAKGVTPEKYKNAIVTIVGGMVTAAHELAKTPDIWKNGPKESWGKGVSAAISGFYPIYEILQKSNSIFASISGSVSVEKYKTGIKSIVGGIISAAHELSKSPDIWKNGPTEAWSKGVTSAINGFYPIYEILQKSNSFMSSFLGTKGITPEKYKTAITTVIGGILEAAKGLGSEENKGIWKNGPGEAWSKSVSIAIKGFYPIYEMLRNSNSIFAGLTGDKGITPKKYKAAITTIIGGILEAAKGLGSEENKGIWKNGPTESWGKGVSAAIKGFYPVYEMLLSQNSMFAKLTGAKYVTPAVFKNAISTITKGIVASAETLSSIGKGSWGNYPDEKWVTGVGGAITAFSPIYDMMLRNSSILSKVIGGVSVDDFSAAIETIVKGIVTAGNKMSESPGAWKNPPPVAWVKGVGGAIGAFAPIFKILSDNSLLNAIGIGVDSDKMKNAIIAITDGIILSATKFNEYKGGFLNYPPVDWADGVSRAIKAFSPIFKSLHEDQGWFTSGEKVIQNINYGITTITDSIVAVNKKFNGLSWDSYPSAVWGDYVKWSIMKYVNSIVYLRENDINGSELTNKISSIESIIDSIVNISQKFKGQDFSNNPINKGWMDGVKWSIQKYVTAIETLEDFDLQPKVLLGYSHMNDIIFNSIVRIANKIKNVEFKNHPSMAWMDNIKWSVMKYVSAAAYLDEYDIDSGLLKLNENAVNSIIRIANKIKGVDFKNHPSMIWMDNIKWTIMKYVSAASYLEENDVNSDLLKLNEKAVNSIIRIANKIKGVDFKNYPSMIWLDNIKWSIMKYSKIATYLYENDIDSRLLSLSEMAINSIVKFANKIKGVDFKNHPSMTWMDNIKWSIMKYSKIATYLDKNNIDSGLLNLNEMVINSIVRIANKFKNLKFGDSDSYLNYMKNLKKSIHSYVDMYKYIAYNKMDDSNNYEVINNVAREMNNTAKILGSGKYLSKSMDPNFMKNLSSNMKYYFEMIDVLNKGNKKMAKGDKSNSLMSKGVNNVAHGIYRLSDAYDRLSNSITKFSKSINQLDPKRVNLFRGMTANISMLSALDSRMFDNMLQVLESRSSVFAKLLESQAAKDSKMTKQTGKAATKSKVQTIVKNDIKKGKFGSDSDQFDIMIELLAYIYRNFSKDSKFDKYLGKRMKQMKNEESMNISMDGSSNGTPQV
jgi:hypothetical protein